MASQQVSSKELHAVIDMGSNGIRFSITDLSSPTARVLPTIFQDRCGISLYDAQYQNGVKIPIPEPTIKEVLRALVNFRRVCEEFGLQDSNIQLVATEATRNAINSKQYLQVIEDETGWEPRLLSKEDEGRLGAMGIASSVDDTVDGLVMDMGGGSVQLTWMEKDEAGKIDLSCFRSYPYGAAALMAQSPQINVLDESSALTKNLSSDLQTYFEDLRVQKPAAWCKKVAARGISLYLSGGGFRSWGHILMSMATTRPYPIPIVNGFVVEGSDLLPDIKDHDFSTESHRISSRRASQVPAIQYLLTAVVKALENLSISKATFCQGGVREGLLYSSLTEVVRARNALGAASTPFAPKSASMLTTILSSSLPDHGRHGSLIPAIVNLLYYYDSYPKDIRAAAALRSTTTGILANTHGISHYDRRALALILCERCGGENDVPLSERSFLRSLEDLEGPAGVWWARYLGCMANGIAQIYPAGLVREPLVSVNAGGVDRLHIRITALRGDIISIAQSWAKQIKKLGKRQRQGEHGQSHCPKDIAVDVVLDRVSDR